MTEQTPAEKIAEILKGVPFAEMPLLLQQVATAAGKHMAGLFVQADLAPEARPTPKAIKDVCILTHASGIAMLEVALATAIGANSEPGKLAALKLAELVVADNRTLTHSAGPNAVSACDVAAECLKNGNIPVQREALLSLGKCIETNPKAASEAMKLASSFLNTDSDLSLAALTLFSVAVGTNGLAITADQAERVGKMFVESRPGSLEREKTGAVLILLAHKRDDLMEECTVSFNGSPTSLSRVAGVAKDERTAEREKREREAAGPPEA